MRKGGGHRLFIEAGLCASYGPAGISIAPALATAAAVFMVLLPEPLLGPKSFKRMAAWPTMATMMAMTTGDILMRRRMRVAPVTSL
jgi:hypothetical protein